jgi:hypothetical protein
MPTPTRNAGEQGAPPPELPALHGITFESVHAAKPVGEIGQPAEAAR